MTKTHVAFQKLLQKRALSLVAKAKNNLSFVSKFPLWGVVLVILIAVSLPVAVYTMQVSINKQTAKQGVVPAISPIPTIFVSEENIATLSATKSPTKLSPTPTPRRITQTPTPTSVAAPTINPTNTPVRVPNPPIINLSYPSENQSITFTSSAQTFCIVDTPSGGDTSGLQRKHNINNQGWNAYVDMYTLCFAPRDGDNTVSLQYKNKYGDESTMYTRQFTFHLILPTPTPTSGVTGCGTPVIFTVLQTGSAIIKVDGAWWFSVKAIPNFINADFDAANKSITLHFNAEHGVINIHKEGYEGAPVCQTYSF